MASCCPFIYPGRAGHNITSEPDIQTSMTTSFFHRRCGQLRLRYKILPASRKPNSCISRPRATKTTNEARSRARSIPYLCLGQCCSLQCLSVLVHTDNEIKNESRLTQAYLCNVVQTCIRKIPGNRLADYDRSPAKQQLCSSQSVWMPPIYMRSKVGSCIVQGSWICSEPPVRRWNRCLLLAHWLQWSNYDLLPVTCNELRCREAVWHIFNVLTSVWVFATMLFCV